MPNPKAEKLKGEGNQFFKNGEYAKAIEKYKLATAEDPNVPAYWCVVYYQPQPQPSNNNYLLTNTLYFFLNLTGPTWRRATKN